MEDYLAGLGRPSGLPRAMLVGFLDAVPASTAILDTRGNIVAVNKAWCSFASDNGGRADGWVGMNYLSFAACAAPSDSEEDHDGVVVAEGVRKVLAGDWGWFDHEYPCHSPTEQRWFRCLTTALADEGSLAGVAVMHLDITRQKLAELRAQLASRAKSEFLASLSHELRTPLNAIIGFSEMMTMQVWGGMGDHHYETYAEDIHHAGTHLLSLINEILDLSKVEAGRFELRDEMVDLCSIGERALTLVSEHAARAGVTLTADLKPGLRLRGDSRILSQIFLNLLSNAVKFTPSEGSVSVATHLNDKGWLELSVRDTGIGIAAEDLERALEPFGQVDSTHPAREGTGLGLPLTRRFVELHGGRLELASAIGQGTTVTAHFPPERVVLN